MVLRYIDCSGQQGRSVHSHKFPTRHRRIWLGEYEGGETLEKGVYEKAGVHSDIVIVDVFPAYKRKLAVPASRGYG